MRRFLDWTAAQAGSQSLPPNRLNSQASNKYQFQQNQQQQQQQQQQFTTQNANSPRELEIQHLRKLLHEIKYYQNSSSPLPSANSLQNQRYFIEKIQKTLPLFLNVFSGEPPSLSTISFTKTSSQSSIDQTELLHSSSSGPSKPNSPLPPKTPNLDEFPDLQTFAFTIARLFVSEIRSRASSKNAEDASLAILQFINYNDNACKAIQDQTQSINSDTVTTGETIQVQNDVNSGLGWNLLLSLNALVKSQNSQIIQILCEASLPSTLVKCLYLFFDLPPCLKLQSDDGAETNLDVCAQATGSVSNSTNLSSENGPMIKIFTELLNRLCHNQAAIDELIKRDDLRLLIGIASSQCLPHNRPWRRTALQTLLSISKNMRDNFIYIERNLCIQNYVENMNRMTSLGLANIYEYTHMISTLLEFVYNLDVNNRNQVDDIAPLVDQFKASRLVDLIEELIIKIDESLTQEIRNSDDTSADVNRASCLAAIQQSSNNESTMSIQELKKCGRKVVQSLSMMAKININKDMMLKLVNFKPLATSRFEMLEQFKMPKPSAKNCILNYDALRLLKMVWSKCQDVSIIEAILDTTISLFNEDKFNYFVFESQQLLVYYMTSNNFSALSLRIKQKLFKFLEFILIETNYIPCVELVTLGNIIKKKTTPEVDLIIGLKTVIACLKFNSKLSDIFREIGLLEIIIELLLNCPQYDQSNHSTNKLEILSLLLQASQHLLAGPNNLNCSQFNESGAARFVFNCISNLGTSHLSITHGSSSDESGTNEQLSKNNTPILTTFPKVQVHSVQQNWADVQQGISIKDLQKISFAIIRQLILSATGDEHLANLLGLLARNLDDLKCFELPNQETSVDTVQAHDDIRSQSISQLSFTQILSQEVNLKICILKSLMIIMKDSHRCRTLFRKTGGFTYIVSSLVTLENSLPLIDYSNKRNLSSNERWRKISSRRVWRLIRSSLMTIVIAIRHEPANFKVFSEGVLNDFTNALKRLGCFRLDVEVLPKICRSNDDLLIENFEAYKSTFLAHPTRDFSTIANENLKANEACCQLFRYLYDMSLDLGDGTAELEIQLERQGQLQKVYHQAYSKENKSISFDQSSGLTTSNEPGVFKRRSQLSMAQRRPPSLDLNSSRLESATLTFPSIIISILDLIPSCPAEDLMSFTCLVIKSLLKLERNQQLLCEAGMITKLSSTQWGIALIDKNHFLHHSVKYMVDNLSKHKISVRELRSYLRLDDPLKCINLDDIKTNESCDETRKKLFELSQSKESMSTSACTQTAREKILKDRIEGLVSMMGDEQTRIQPPFVEFDMSIEGSSSIFMPSIAPINVRSLPANSSSFFNSTLEVHANEKNGILGGVGSTERVFPPINGFTFSSWICIENFPPRSSDPIHNLRLLTIYRGSAATGKEYCCLRILISALDRALIVSTQEAQLFDNESKPDAISDAECNLRIWNPEMLCEGKWHHIAISINRSLLKQSVIHVFIDGVLSHQQRISYISNYVGSTNSGPLGNSNSSHSNCAPAAYVNAFIGSLPQLRYQLRTRWKQGPCHLIEETLSSNFIGIIYSMGPNYIGNFQSAQLLNEMSKARSTHCVLHQSKDHKNDSQNPIHRQLVHQQSAAMAQVQHFSQNQLIRVSSSNLSSNHPNSQHASSNPRHQVNSIHEDRILIGIDARATSLMTLSRMRRIYTRFDCRQISRVLGLALHENSAPILLLHNTGVHLNGPSRSIGASVIGYNHVRCFVPSPTQFTLVSLGGSYILLGLIAQAQTCASLSASMRSLVTALKYNVKLQAQMENINGYQLISVFLWKKKQLLNSEILDLVFSLVTDTVGIHEPKYQAPLKMLHQVGALCDLVCENFDLWLQVDMIDQVLEFIHNLITSESSEQLKTNFAIPNSSARMKNLKCLRDMDLLPRLLRLLPKYGSQVDSDPSESGIRGLLCDYLEYSDKMPRAIDTKTIFLIKQTVFELLNKTPRQSDILYFGQFLASLLPSNYEECSSTTVNLRNILLKSLLQMLTKNTQREVNQAMQEELVRILGFDWFMLFISGSHLDIETKTIGLLNLMIILSNDDIYFNFKSNGKMSNNGGWLKEPTFPTIDGKFNIQLLGINVGVFLGLSKRKKAIKHDALEAPNFFLLSSYLTELVELPHIYLLIFHSMMSRLIKLDPQILCSIESFKDLSFDLLCDCLIGDTHHIRRQTLSQIQFKSHELVVCIVYMIKDIMWRFHYEQNQSGHSETSSSIETSNSKLQEYPVEIMRFLMYLYNNSQDFQSYCKRSNELVDVLCLCLMQPDVKTGCDPSTNCPDIRMMTKHQASKEILEFSRIVILDTISDEPNQPGDIEQSNQLHLFERYLESLNPCRQAQGELVDMLLRQVLLMIDSTARHNSIKTMNAAENILQFQLLLINSISIMEVVTDKIWLQHLYSDNWVRVLTIIDHHLCLAEQIFKFSEILPKHNPPHPFIMQRVLNRLLLFALSRPIQHMSDKMIVLDLLKKIYDNRTIIILNHMHSAQSAEFFVCFTYCLLKIIEANSVQNNPLATQSVGSQTKSLIERQFGNPSMTMNRSDPNTNGPSPSALIIVSVARKVWDTIYQSKKSILSEALEVSLSLPAFTLETSPDLLQLKPDIIDSCERYWASFCDSKYKFKRRKAQNRQAEPNPTGSSAATSAVNLLSGRLTRVVNAASFVSRVVGATAGTMASNVNLVGEKLGQSSKPGRLREMNLRSSSDASGATAQASNLTGQLSIAPDQDESFKSTKLDSSELKKATQIHISIIQDYIESQLTKKSHTLALHRYLCDEWLDIERETLLRERAIFGPDYGSKLDKWCLDLTEGPRRMRKKMANNTRQFYQHYPYQPEQYNPDNKSLRYRPPMSYDSHEYYLKTVDLDDNLLEITSNRESTEKVLVEVTCQYDTEPLSRYPNKLSGSKKSPKINIDTPKPDESEQELESSLDSLGQLSLQASGKSLPIASSPKPSETDADGDGDSSSFVDFSPEIEAESNSARESENIDSLSVLRLLEKNERISHMFRCSRVQGLDTYEGLLLFGREHFYLIDGFTLLKTREIKDIDSLPPDSHDPIIPNSNPNILAHSKKTCSKFSFDSVVEVHKRRYLLQPIALEVFSSDGRNTLIVFPRNIRNKVYSRLMTVSTQMNNNAHESLAGQKSNVSVEGGSGLLSNLIGETSVTQRWVRGELSNFQYLMNLNTIAGRSYNDLMQYPIFPWILADYTSDQLDLTNPSTFRDLSKPIGAQTSERLEQFRRRYIEWDDAETPPYHYGTFYSSAMIVASYMVRMEPFTQHFLRLQGGHFDLADRMFHSINDSWLSASKHNMADIKELIPEFFYLPEFLKNDNNYDLGIKQNGMKLDDVILPAWAKGDAREFIRVHRCALESDYVSNHLNEWIDLIFGYKQQGRPAIDAVNVFHHLFYEGNVDIYNTDIDPIKKNAVIGFINNFGQVPKQLFKKPHPVRKVSSSSAYTNLPSSIPLNPILPSLSGSSGSTSVQRVLTRFPQALRQSNIIHKELRGPVGQIVQIDKSVVAVEQNKLLIPPEFCRYVAWGHADRSLRMGLYDSEKPIFVWEGGDSIMTSEILCCTIPNSRTMITSGTESLITVWKIEKMKSISPLMNLYGHLEPITCLASSQAYSIIVSGSRDRTAIVWDLNRFTFVRQLGGGPSDNLTHHGPLSAIAINDSTGDIATCSSSWLYLWTINGELLAFINTMSSVSIQRSMCHGYSSIAGNLGNQLHLLSVCFSQYNEWDSNEMIVTGASDGSVAFWSMRYYQSPTNKFDEEQLTSEKAKSSCDLSETDKTNKNINSIEIPTEKNESNSTSGDNQTRSKVASETDSRYAECCTELIPNTVAIASNTQDINPSEPIEIGGRRRRTSTMNSEWVKLSASSTSTDQRSSVATTPAQSLNDQLHDNLLISGLTESSDNMTIDSCSLGGNQQIVLERSDDVLQSLPEKCYQNDQPFCSAICANHEIVGTSSLCNISNGKYDEELVGQSPSQGTQSLLALDPSVMKFSKSDNSLVESFVLIGGEGSIQIQGVSNNRQQDSTRIASVNERARPQSSASPNLPMSKQPRPAKENSKRLYKSKLLPNHQWCREIYLRAILPKRNEKSFPAAVTSLTISKDHKTIYVGDASGKVISWQII